MKNMTKTLTLVLALVLALCVSAFAAEPTQSGVYDLTVSEGYTMTPNTAASADEITISGGTVDNFFPEAEKFTLSYAETNAENYHMVLVMNDDSGVPTESNLVYIDQTAMSTSGTIDFTVYPSELVGGETYYVYVVGTALDKTQVASFSYYEYEAPSVAEYNGTKYETLSAAITAARTAGGTVTLLSDATESPVRVWSGITLDLAGHKLTAAMFIGVNGSSVVDSSAGNVGRLVCADPMFSATNSDLPILDTDGYLFAAVTKMNQTGSGDGSKYTYIFRPVFESGMDVLGARGTDANVAFKLVLSWDGGEKTFDYTTDLVKDVYANNKAFYAWVTNYASYVEKNLTITVNVVADNTVTIAGTPWEIA